MILYMKTFFAPDCHLRKKIPPKTKLSHSSLLISCALHTSSSTFKYDSKIDSIKSDHFSLGKNINKLIQPKQVDSNTNSSQNIYPFSYLGLGLWLRFNQPLSCSRYISLHATTRVSYYFYVYALCKYYHTNKDGGVLGHTCHSQVFPH